MWVIERLTECLPIFQQNDGALRNKAQALLKSEPGITLYEALALFVEASFKNQYFSVDASGTSAPKLNLDAIAATIAAEAQKKLDEAIAAEKERRLEEMRKTLQIPRPPEEA